MAFGHLVKKKKIKKVGKGLRVGGKVVTKVGKVTGVKPLVKVGKVSTKTGKAVKKLTRKN